MSRKYYPKPSVTVDILLIWSGEKEEKVLLIQRKNDPYRSYWAFPGGFLDMEKDETIHDAANRELLEETGINASLGIYQQFDCVGSRTRDPRDWTVSVLYVAYVDEKTAAGVVAGDDAEQAKWFAVEEVLASLPLAFDHKERLGRYFKEYGR